MPIFFITSGLDKELIRKIESGQMEEAELQLVYEQVKAAYYKYAKGLKIAMICMLAIWLSLLLLSIPVITNEPILFMSIYLILGVILVGVILLVKKVFVDRVKQQFIKATKKGYPQLVETLRF